MNDVFYLAITAGFFTLVAARRSSYVPGVLPGGTFDSSPLTHKKARPGWPGRAG